MEKIRIFLVDDQKLFVENLKIVLEARTKDMEVVGLACNGSEALERLAGLEVDLVLLDVRMPVLDGVETARLIHQGYPSIKIIMLTTFDDDVYVHKALEHGAAGYILKNIPPQDLFASIRAVHGGSMLVSPDVMQKLLKDGEAAPGRLDQPDLRRRIDSLTDRELDILRLLSLAYDSRQIAEKLKIAEQTVKNHISIIYSKMGVSKRAQLMRLFMEHPLKELLVRK